MLQRARFFWASRVLIATAFFVLSLASAFGMDVENASIDIAKIIVEAEDGRKKKKRVGVVAELYIIDNGNERYVGTTGVDGVLKLTPPERCIRRERIQARPEADTLFHDSPKEDCRPEMSFIVAQAIEEIIVTGSRIPRTLLDEAGPIAILTSEDLGRSGLTSVADFLQRLPVSGGSLNTRFNSSGNFGSPPDGGGIGAGAALVDLRFLGSKRVLVLVDGIRWVNESSASGVSSTTDLNTIPNSIIEQIEVLKDGASSVYGSDAIAGVVNIITKKDFDGLEISAYAGAFDEGDGETQEFSLSIGSKGERSSVFLNLNFVDQKNILARDRAQSSTPIPLVTSGQGGSSGTPQGRFFLDHPGPDGIFGTPDDFGVDCALNDGVTGTPFFDVNSPCNGDDYHPFTTADRFNFSQFNLVLTPSKRTSVYGQAQYVLSDNVSLYIKGLYNNRQSTNQAAPEPLFIGPEAGNGNLLDTISVDVTNPFNPFGFTIDAASNSFFMGRRPLEGGPRIFNQNVNTFYVVGGLQGQFYATDRDFYWDINVAMSENRADQIKMGGYNSANLRQALGPVANCTAPCVPFNFFGGQGSGGGTITQAMLDFVGFIQKDVSEQELLDITANIIGEIVELPAGPLGFAVGYEHREQDAFFLPDSVVISGESAGVPSSPTAGGFDTDEFYAEFNVPILADRLWAEYLELSAAVRTSDYSTISSETTTKFGLIYRPTENILFRGTFSEGLRAPGIGELFASASRFDQTLNDPCSDFNGMIPGNMPADPQTIANCITLGVPTDGSYVQFNPQISVTTGGNPNLQPETVDSITIGGVYDAGWVKNVSWIDRLKFELTYYSHELDGAIQALDAEVQLSNCVATLDPTLCGGISRTPGGVINAFSNQLTNIGGIDTSGWDFSVNYVSPKTDVGTFSISWQSTFLDEFIQIIPTSTGFIDVLLEGTETGDPEQAYPEYKSTLIVNWLGGDWNTSLTFRFIDSVTEACTGLGGLGLCSDEANELNKIDSTTYLDIQGTWRPQILDSALAITLGFNNVLDEGPPPCFSCALNGFDATTYEIPGVFGYVRVSWKHSF